ncbi:transcriptional regulator [Vibrio sp. VPAP30]|uniref:Transcriptional regulator n=2 Tax=Vibrionaceae TaxID=641 RepID=A0A177XUI0_9VIBR|nr:transcriptional regulator [Vibrio sp. VPAP30]OAJ92270.1 transcriptional regulator [Vibrio bivalvicida]
MHLADKEPPIAPKEVNRRERKKQMVRNALLEASYQLFVSKGFDETRIEDITDIVDISSRTFFRYFSCKEDLVLDYYEVEQKEILVALASRPMSESIYTAIRKAAVEVTKGCEEGSYGIDPKRFATIRNLIRKHPMVCARKLSRSESYNQALSDLIAARMEVSMLKDIRPRVLAASIEFAYSTSYDLWKSESQNNMSYYEVLNDVFLFLENNEL